ncbi:unnamed protein product, partial [marine sediment metagenome]
LLRVYVVLPPAPPGPGARDGGGFGPGHIAALSDALRDGGRALFLACYGEMRQMGFWAPPMRLPYGWNDYLAEEWGLVALTEFRLIQGIPDKEEGKFGVNAERYYWMRLNHFNDKNPVGRPLDARRVLLVDACPVEKADRTPEGVTYETILDVPYNDRSIWATTRDVRGIVRELYTSGKVTVTPDQGGGTGDKIPPMDVMVQAVREPTEEGQTEKSMIIVFGEGRIQA